MVKINITVMRYHVIILIVFFSLARLNIQYPMLFKLINNKTHRETHCGVLEFVADEGRIYLPYWVGDEQDPNSNLVLDVDDA